jgi:hypothetical protein
MLPRLGDGTHELLDLAELGGQHVAAMNSTG